MYRRPAYYDRGSQPRFSTLQFSPRLASPPSFFFPSSFLFSTDRTKRSTRFFRFVFSPVSLFSIEKGRGNKSNKEGREEKEREKKRREERRESWGSRITGKEAFIENAVPLYRCPYVYLPFINSRSDNFFSKLRDSGVTHVDTYIAYICFLTVYPYTRGNVNDRYFSILLEGRRGYGLESRVDPKYSVRYNWGGGEAIMDRRCTVARSGVIRLRSDACSVTARRDALRPKYLLARFAILP